MLNEQLIFNLTRRSAFNREDYFISSTNNLSIKILDNWNKSFDTGLIIVGPAACGKSHLSAVWSKETSAIIYNFPNFLETDIKFVAKDHFIVLEDLEMLQLVNDKKKLIVEEKILHIFNNLSENSGKIIFTSRKLPKFWGIELKDLLSRLMSLTILELNIPDDNLLEAVMAKQFLDKQIKVDNEVLKYAIPRMERSFLFAKKLVEELDIESLKTNKPIKKIMVSKIIERLNSKT